MAQITLKQFREQYPQYSGKSDEELADALHRKFYSSIPRDEFNTRIGLTSTPLGDRTMTVGGREIAMAEYRAMPPDQRQALRGQVATADPNSHPEWETPKTTGLWENVGAGIDNGANSLLGAPVDIPVWLGNSLINATNTGVQMAGGGRPLPNIPIDLPGSRLGFERVQEGLGFTPPSAVEPADPGQALARAGAEAATMSVLPETILMRGAQALKSAPPAIASGMDMLQAAFGQSRTAGQFVRNTATNAAAGAGAQAAMDAAPEGWEPVAGLAGGIGGAGLSHAITGIPGAVRQRAQMAGEYLAPITAAGRERLAGQTLREAATSPGSAIEALSGNQQIVPGSQPTTFQQSGDMGLGALERGVAARNPAEFMQRRADQNAARVGAMGALQPGGAPEAVVGAVRGHLAGIEAQADAIVAAANRSADQNSALRGAVANATTDAAREAGEQAVTVGNTRARDMAGHVGTGAAPDVVGGTMREALEAARTVAKEQEDRLWSAVDPDGALALSPSQTKDAAKQIIAETPASARQPGGEEAAIYGVISRYGETIPLRELSALHTRIKDQLREMRSNGLGESTPYRRLTQLNNSVFADLNEAVAARVVHEEQAVSAGRMDQMDTIAARLRSEAQAFLEARKAETRLVSGEGASGDARGRSIPISGSDGAKVPRGRGFGNAPRNPRLSGDGLEPNFDEAALERLSAARDTTQQRVNTFDNGTLGPLRRRPSTQSPYDLPASAVPGRIFFAGPKSIEAIQQYRNAVGDAVALPALRDYAADRFRRAAMRPDGTVDPAKAETWLRQHSDALRALPDVRDAIRNAGNASRQAADIEGAQRTSLRDLERDTTRQLTEAQRVEQQQVAQIAREQKQRVDAAQIGVVGRLLGLETPDDVVRVIGSIFSRQDASNQILRLRGAIAGNKEAAEGLRKAIAEYVTGRFVGNTEAGTSGIGTMKSDQFQTFIRQNEGALKLAGFSNEEVEVMKDIARDLQQANRSVASVKLPGGSNTVQDVLAAKVGHSKQTIFSKALAATVVAGPSFLLGGPLGGFAALLGANVVSRMREAGLTTMEDLLKDAMLHPERARLLMLKATPANAKLVGPSLAQMYRRAAVQGIRPASGEREKELAQ